MRIVSAGPSDIEALFEIYAEVAAEGGAEPQSAKSLQDTFIEGWVEDRSVYAVHVGGVTAGGYFLRPNFPAFAGHIAQAGYLVARPMRRRGIGSRLVQHSLHEAARVGYRAMMFNLVMETNPSRQLYESAGFEVIGAIPDVHGTERALIYWRRLKS